MLLAGLGMALLATGEALAARPPTFREREAIGGQIGRRAILAVAKNEAMRAIVGRGAEQSRHDHARGHGAPHRRVGPAGEREIHVVHDERARRGVRGEAGRELRGVARGDFQHLVQLRRGHIARGLELVVELAREILRERDRREPVQRAFPGAADRAARDDEAERGVEAHVDAADHRIELRGRRQQVAHGDVHRIARRPVDDPRGAAEAALRRRGVHGPAAGFGGADPALLVLRRHDVELMARGAQRMDELVQENAVDAIVVGDEKTHAASAQSRAPRAKEIFA